MKVTRTGLTLNTIGGTGLAILDTEEPEVVIRLTLTEAWQLAMEGKISDPMVQNVKVAAALGFSWGDKEFGSWL